MVPNPRRGTPGAGPYAKEYDRDLVVFDNNQPAIVFHECFRPAASMTAVEVKELAIKQAALRIAAGLELRSLRELAAEIGCSHTAIDNAALRICERAGIRKFKTPDASRRRQRQARQRQLLALMGTQAS